MKEKDSAVIESAKRTHLSLILLVFAFSYVALMQIGENQFAKGLQVADKLLILRQTARAGTIQILPTLKLSDLPKFYFRANMLSLVDSIARRSKEIQRIKSADDIGPPSVPVVVPEPPDGEVSGAFLTYPLSTHFGSTDSCRMVGYSLDPSRSFSVSSATDKVFAKVMSGQDIFLVNFDYNCGETFTENDSFLLIRNGDGWLIGISPADRRMVATLPDQFNGIVQPVKIGQEALSNYNADVRRFIGSHETYEVYSLEAVEKAILSWARLRNDAIFAPEEFRDAVHSLFSDHHSPASLLGVAMDQSFFLRALPLVMVALLYTLWRRVRQIRPRNVGNDVLWFLTDADDILGWSFAKFWAATPFLCAIVVLVLFAAASQVLPSIVYAVDWLRMGAPAYLPVTQQVDWAAIAIATLLVVQLALALATSRLLFAICRKA